MHSLKRTNSALLETLKIALAQGSKAFFDETYAHGTLRQKMAQLTKQ